MMEQKQPFLLAHDRSHMTLQSILLADYCFVRVHQQIQLMSHGKRTNYLRFLFLCINVLIFFFFLRNQFS